MFTAISRNQTVLDKQWEHRTQLLLQTEMAFDMTWIFALKCHVKRVWVPEAEKITLLRLFSTRPGPVAIHGPHHAMEGSFGKMRKEIRRQGDELW